MLGPIGRKYDTIYIERERKKGGGVIHAWGMKEGRQAVERRRERALERSCCAKATVQQEDSRGALVPPLPSPPRTVDSITQSLNHSWSEGVCTNNIIRRSANNFYVIPG